MAGDIGEPDCPSCRGVGYVRLNLPINHPDFGKLFACDCAESKIEARKSAQLRQNSSLEPDDYALRFSGYRVSNANRAAVEAVRDTMMRGWGWCYLHGQPGNGKTRLLKTAIAEAISEQQGGVYVLWADMLGHIREGFSSDDSEARIAKWVDAPILAVDEFSRAKESEWVQEVTSRIFSRRYEQALYKRSLTLFGSNFAPDVAAEWMADRINDGRFYCVEVTAPSMRPAMR